MDDDQPRPARHADDSGNQQTEGGVPLVLSQTYEITFAGQAGAALREEFDDCEVTIGKGTTTLRVELPDPSAFAGLMQRIAALRLDVIHAHQVASSPEP